MWHKEGVKMHLIQRHSRLSWVKLEEQAVTTSLGWKGDGHAEYCSLEEC